MSQEILEEDGRQDAGEAGRNLHGSIFWDIEEGAIFDETKNTHLWMVIRATRLASSTPEGAAFAQLFPPVDGEIHQDFHDQLCRGIYEADFGRRYNDDKTWVSHFYDPSTGKNYREQSYPTALTRGAKFFAMARDAHVQGRTKDAGFHLGLALHYFTDLSQPMHASNYTFFSSLPAGFHSAVESYAMQVQEQTPMPTTAPQDDEPYPEHHLVGLAWRSRGGMKALLAAEKYWPFGPWREHAREPALHALATGVAATSSFVRAWMRSTRMRYVSLCAVIRDPGKSAPVLEVCRSPDGEHWSPGEAMFPGGVGGYRPAAAVFHGLVHAVFGVIQDGQMILMHTSSPTGEPGAWTAPQRLPCSSEARPALCVYRNRLYLVYRGFEDQNLWWASTRDGSTWESHGAIGEWNSHQAYSSPTLALLGDSMYCLHRGLNAGGVDDDRLWACHLNGNQWSADELVRSERGEEFHIVGEPSAVYWLDRLAVYIQQKGEHRCLPVMSRDGRSWMAGMPQAAEAAQLVAVGGKVISTGTRGEPGSIRPGGWSRVSYDLRTFTPRAPLFDGRWMLDGPPATVVVEPD